MTPLLNGDGLDGHAAILRRVANPLCDSGSPSGPVDAAADKLLWPTARRKQTKRILIAAGALHSLANSPGGFLYRPQQAAGRAATTSGSASHGR